MRILITGGSGFIGRALIPVLQASGHEILVVSRKAGAGRLTYEDSAPAVDAIVNLAGESVVGLWTGAKKRRILESRLAATRWCVETLRRSTSRPRVFISASAIGYYGDRPGERLAEESSPGPPNDFLVHVAKAWEEAAKPADALGVRTVYLRISQVMHPEGGFLGPILPLFRLGLCVGAGRPDGQVSWITRQDLCRLILWAIETPTVSGPLNAAAPHACTAAELYGQLAEAVGRRLLFFAPPALLRLALGEFSQEILSSKQVIPARATSLGFIFEQSHLPEAIRHLFPERR